MEQEQPKKLLFSITLGQLRYMKESGYLSEKGLGELQDFEQWLDEEYGESIETESTDEKIGKQMDAVVQQGEQDG